MFSLGWETSIGLRAADSGTYYIRASAWRFNGEWKKAIEDLDESILLDRKNPYPYCLRATIKATCPVDKFRDGKQALKDAKRGCELTSWKNGWHLEALAAAYAELGEYPEAVKWQSKAIDDEAFFRSRGDSARSRLELFEANKPVRLAPLPVKD
jgi:tetratricopeptide (TPR) repeat protein